MDFFIRNIEHLERSFDIQSSVHWIQEHWTDSILYSLIYVVLVFGGHHLMKSRIKFDLRILLGLWSATLGIFSITGAFRTTQNLIDDYTKHGLDYTICDPSFYFGPYGAWYGIFAFSKLPELIDTAFIVLRKQPLIFLHWYHHAATLIISWLGYAVLSPVSRWSIVINFIVHAFMYSYYALRAMRVRIPRPVSIMITVMQLVQMFVMTWLLVRARRLQTTNAIPCACDVMYIDASLAMYISYFILFGHFFYNAYIQGNFRKDPNNNAKQNGHDKVKKLN